MIRNLAIALVTLLGTAGLAQAATFAKMDTDHSGALSPQEFMAAYPKATKDLWTSVDTNGDGKVTEQELQAAVKAGTLPAG